MAAGTGSELVTPTPEEREVAELAAARADMVAATRRMVESVITSYGLPPAEAAEKVKGWLEHEPERLDAEQVSWFALNGLLETNPERGQAAWRELKDVARRELATGFRAARALERPVSGRPAERAQFMAIVEALRVALGPRDALEELLVQQMATAHELHLRWQAVAVQRIEEGAWQGERDKRRALEDMTPAKRERYQQDTGWLPPRVAETAALDQAVLTADRYQRAFLRLAKAFRDNRRMFASLVVAGGQVNIAEQQVNLNQEPA